MKRKAHSKHPDELPNTGFSCMNPDCGQLAYELFLDPETGDNVLSKQKHVCAECLKKIERRERKCAKAKDEAQTEQKKKGILGFLRAKFVRQK